VSDSLRGRHVAITGAGTGIGRAVALRLASDGARLALLARDAGRLRETADACVAAGADEALVQTCDVRDAASVERAFAAVADAGGPLHGLVASAGLGGPNEGGPGDRFEALVETNLVGTYRCVRAARAQRTVVIASILARIGVAGYTGYSAGKAGLLGLVRSFAMELAPDGATINAICPGWVDTDMAREGIEGFARATDRSYEDAYAAAMADVPLGRMSRPDEIAGTVAWLLRDEAAMVTGQTIDHNGGAWVG
jgi:NAD(P)-dependent dehydrogenase (short-subunit alcohol dehydrogenase family)